MNHGEARESKVVIIKLSLATYVVYSLPWASPRALARLCCARLKETQRQEEA